MDGSKDGYTSITQGTTKLWNNLSQHVGTEKFALLWLKHHSIHSGTVTLLNNECTKVIIFNDDYQYKLSELY